MKSTLLVLALALGAMLPVPIRADDNEQGNKDSEIRGGFSVAVTGTSSTGPVNGTFTIKKFGLVDNKLNAFGTLKLNNVVTSVAMPVIASNPTTALGSTNAVYNNTRSEITAAPAAAASCPILHLVLGPLSLNLLGLQVNLNQVVLDITAIPGAGNLLGNLLCDIANLLNPTSGLNQLIARLNQLLALL